MIVVTGGAGFIGSVLIWRLNQEGYDDIVVVDNFGDQGKWQNIAKRRLRLALHKDEFLPWLARQEDHAQPQVIFHLGACSSTMEHDFNYLLTNNVHYSMRLFEHCHRRAIPFIYASSAATYGGGEQGYDDSHEVALGLRPLNPYGYSKQMFDAWALKQQGQPPFWAGLKFFNVYGPNEYHKGSMRSLVCKALPQIQADKQLSLFKSYLPGVEHGQQRRDFVYVKDAVDVMMHLWNMSHLQGGSKRSGLYNVGTGSARSFADLGKAVFKALGLASKLTWVDMPAEIRDGYQYFTEANLTRLREQTGYRKAFTPIEEAVEDYVCNYLTQKDPFL